MTSFTVQNILVSESVNNTIYYDVTSGAISNCFSRNSCYKLEYFLYSKR